MINLSKLHLKYIFSKINYLIILSLISLITFIMLFNARVFTSKLDRWLDEIYILINYQTSFQLIIKLISIILACFLFGSSFSNQNDQYAILTKDFTIHRFNFILTKLLVLSFTICLFLLITFLIYELIGVIFIDSFFFSYKDLLLLGSLLLISLSYGFLTSILTILFHNQLMIILTYGLYLTSEIISSKKALIIKGITLFFPSLIINEDKLIISNGIIPVVLLIIWELIIIIWRYLRKDF